MEGTEKLYDVIVIGGGPAGLTAAIYLARARYRVLVIEKEQFGGQITITSEVVNYPGIRSISGRELTDSMRKQAERFGAEFLLAEAEELDLTGDVKVVYTSRGELSCFGILLATGAHPRMIGFTGEEEFRGHGVAYCATCDGEFFTGKEVFVVGGGFAAAEESVFLTKYAKHVTVLVREEDFTCAQATAQAARDHEKITVLTDTQVEEVSGDSVLRYIRYRNSRTGEVTEFRTEDDTFGVFVFAGYEPETALLRDKAEVNEQGYVVTDRNQSTNLPGVYAAGDVCVKPLRQVVTAVGDGALAATELERYAAEMQHKTGLHPMQKNREEAARPTDHNGFFPEEMQEQLGNVFAQMQSDLILKLYLNDLPVSNELQRYMEELAKLTDKLHIEMGSDSAQTERPCVEVVRKDGEQTGLLFHGAPGGHEFTSFVLGLYNAAGPGQELEEDVVKEIRAIDSPIRMQIVVSLSCTVCPEVVTAAQRIAVENPLITAEVYDINHFAELKDKYQVMSVPCLIVNEKEVLFGKKSIRQLLDILKGIE